MMSNIRAKNSRPEMIVRKGLHARGFRYRLHDRRLPGKPDLVFPRYHAVIMVHGCFWHCHGCHLFKWPSTRKEFWKEKVEGNRARDAKKLQRLLAEGWRVLIMWECTFKGRYRRAIDQALDEAAKWICSGNEFHQIAGKDSDG